MSTNTDDFLHRINSAVDIIQHSKQGVVLTGAGISTPSGIPDFRSTKAGLWQRYDPFEVASLTAFRYQPEKLYTWMRPLATEIVHAIPNTAHLALATLQKEGYLVNIITQNIDALHQKAGSDEVIEVHGTLNSMTCIACFNKYNSEKYLAAYIENGEIPYCPSCNNILKPDIILFGEQLPIDAWLKANLISKHCDLMIVVGSSLEVLPVASLPMRALDNGARLIIVNNSQTYLNIRADVVFFEDVTEVLPKIARAVLIT